MTTRAESYRLPPGPGPVSPFRREPALRADLGTDHPWNHPFAPGTLACALVAEEHGDGTGHVRFKDGVPYWEAGPARFPIIAEVAL